jgi:hypothetical protein
VLTAYAYPGGVQAIVVGSAAGVKADEGASGVAVPGDVAPTVPAAPLVATGSTARGGGVAVHVQIAGQSASTLHVVALGEQKPGKLVVVVHASGGVGATVPAGGLEAESEAFGLEPPTEVVPAVPAAPPPEQAVVTDASQLKPSPQSLSLLQGSCHL